MNKTVKSFYNDLFIRYPELEILKESVQEIYVLLCHCYKNQGKILICGNGGSASDAEHMTAELMKGFLLPRQLNSANLLNFDPKDERDMTLRLQQGLSAISLNSQMALMTAILNDIGADMIFAQQVFVYGQKDDIFIGFSTSGNSKNIINAVKVAKAKGMKTVIFTGKSGGRVKSITDYILPVPEEAVYKIQDYHLPIYHTLCAMLEETFFGTNENDL